MINLFHLFILETKINGHSYLSIEEKRIKMVFILVHLHRLVRQIGPSKCSKKYFKSAESNFKSGNHLDFLVTVQQARRSAREARIIESEMTPNERRIERNEMEKQSSVSSIGESGEEELMSKLVQLAEMRESGILSEEEFVIAKSKLLKL